MHRAIFRPNNKAKILVVGDIILDEYIYGETNRISPEAPVPIVRVNDSEERPGGAANVAVNVSALGLGAEILGIVGNDEASYRLENLLLDKNIKTHLIRQKSYSTISKQRILCQNQQLIRLDYEKDGTLLSMEKLYKRYKKLIDAVDIIVLSDYAKGCLSKVETLIEIAYKKNIPVLVDPKSKDFKCYKYATIITPNLKELEAVVGECRTKGQIIEKGNKLREEFYIESLLVTCGDKGMILLSKDNLNIELKAKAHDVYDVTGAGDTVIATLACALACGYNLAKSMEISNIAAGKVVEKLGTATVSVDEVNGSNIYEDNYDGSVISSNEALNIIDKVKFKNKIIVMTNGCFDILHSGHVTYLSKARELGDFLVVLLNDDKSVKSLKGESRPINSLKSRLKVLSSLSAVDLVVSFNENTPEKLIKLFKPDILVKGGDYTEDQIAGADSVRENGGDVIILPFEEGFSTSLMIEKMQTNK